MEKKPIIIIVTQYYYGNHMFRGINHFPYIQAISLAMSILIMISGNLIEGPWAFIKQIYICIVKIKDQVLKTVNWFN